MINRRNDGLKVSIVEGRAMSRVISCLRASIQDSSTLFACFLRRSAYHYLVPSWGCSASVSLHKCCVKRAVVARSAIEIRALFLAPLILSGHQEAGVTQALA